MQKGGHTLSHAQLKFQPGQMRDPCACEKQFLHTMIKIARQNSNFLVLKRLYTFDL